MQWVLIFVSLAALTRSNSSDGTVATDTELDYPSSGPETSNSLRQQQEEGQDVLAPNLLTIGSVIFFACNIVALVAVGAFVQLLSDQRKDDDADDDKKMAHKGYGRYHHDEGYEHDEVYGYGHYN